MYLLRQSFNGASRLIQRQRRIPPRQIENELFRRKRRLFSGESSQNGKSSGAEPLVEGDESLYIGTYLSRLFAALGMVYVFTEYGIELTICEGPSMLPTIRSSGEIVLMDRLTPRLYGLQGGTVGEERMKQAQQRQRIHEKQEQRNADPTKPYNPTWHVPMVPVNKIPQEGAWDRFFLRLKTGISVGDVIVIQHPDRVGTVCKRVLGLPGDMITKATHRNNEASMQGSGRLQRYGGTGKVVPDGHIWVEGDNPWNSSDSRNYGAVPAGLIVGRVLCRIWPLRGHAIMERGARPERDPSQEPSLMFSGSMAIPAGYKSEIIVQEFPAKEKSES